MLIKKELIPKIFLTILIMLISVLVLIKTIDENAVVQNNELLKKAMSAFLVAKGLNAIVSVAQGTEVGVGFTVAVGEILDPLNDLIEKFSWIMLASTTSLAIQKITILISSWYVFKIFTILLLGILLYFIWRDKRDKLFFITLKILFIFLFLRFAIPATIYANNFIYDNFLKKEYNIEKKIDRLEKITTTLEKQSVDKAIEQKERSFLNKITDSLNVSKIVKSKMAKYKKITKDATKKIIDLIIIFLFQTMFFPLIFLFLLYKSMLSVKWD